MLRRLSVADVIAAITEGDIVTLAAIIRGLLLATMAGGGDSPAIGFDFGGGSAAAALMVVGGGVVRSVVVVVAEVVSDAAAEGFAAVEAIVDATPAAIFSVVFSLLYGRTSEDSSLLKVLFKWLDSTNKEEVVTVGEIEEILAASSGCFNNVFS